MKKFRYSYQSVSRFSKPVIWHSYLLRVVPVQNAIQRVKEHQLILNPAHETAQGTDCWGNQLQYGTILTPHDGFTFMSNGVVELADHYCIPDEAEPTLFTEPTRLTPLSEEMRIFLQGRKLTGSAQKKALIISHRLKKVMNYQPCSTRNDTTASEAFAQHKGVCQDFAHIFIALCRASDIPARYVCGLMAGEGVTHAWTEIYNKRKKCWYGIDPTHDRQIETGYIKIAHGRDVNDCPVNRGNYRGYTLEETEVRVIVEEI